MNILWKPLVDIIENYSSKNITHNIESISNLQLELLPLLNNYQFRKGKELPYGRYLVYKQIENKFNVQIDVFSRNYIGKIHCHNTWGILHVFQGILFVEDWNKIKGNEFVLRGGLVLNKGGSQSFCPPISDWHKVSSVDDSEQAISMHIYGNDFDLDKGIYLNEDFEEIHGNRSTFKEIETINKIINKSGKF